MRASLRPLLLVAVAPAVLVLAGCFGGAGGVTSSNVSCVNGRCTVTLQGQGADADLGADDDEIELTSASEAEGATFEIDDESGSCRAGESVTVAGYAVTCTEVGDDRLVAEIVG